MKQKICVVGLGYVGLTLTGVLLDSGNTVIGLEINENILNSLREGKSHFHEPGLNEILRKHIDEGHFTFFNPNDKTDLSSCSSFIITVGTPLLANSEEPNLEYIKSSLKIISKYINEDKLIVLRSTVIVGLTEEMVIPFLTKELDIPKEKINIVFAPERTVEGDALTELRELPQIVGCNNTKSIELATKLFNTYVKEVVFVESIKQAELTKLFNNVYRDLNFAIGNVFNNIARNYGIDGVKAIAQANYKYQRSNIPLPGFVGGPCLEKDSYILVANLNNARLKNFVLSGRKENEALEDILVSSIVSNHKKSEMILLTGMAFKGKPETGDLRGSNSVNIYYKLLELGFKNIYIHDFIAEKNELELITKQVLDLDEINSVFDLIVIMNNHALYSDNNIQNILNTYSKNLIDIWNITHIEKRKNIGTL